MGSTSPHHLPHGVPQNCFRVVEMGVESGSDVVVLGRPQLQLSAGLSADFSADFSDNTDADTKADTTMTQKHTIDTDRTPLVIGPPKPIDSGNITDPRFSFRILKGHSIDNLLKHRNGNMLAYLGLAAMGVFTVVAGEEAIRDSLVITYM